MRECSERRSADMDKWLEKYFSPVTMKRIRRFRRIKRGYYSFLLILTLYFVSLFSEFLMNNKALVVKYQGHYYFPVFSFYPGKTFGLKDEGEPDYRRLKVRFEKEAAADPAKAGNWVLLPPYPYSPIESLLDLPGEPPHPPSWEHWLGTDDRARDVFVRLVYGFRISITFALVVVFFSYVIGITVGAILGYFGGRVDILGQRLVEIWSSLPFLYTVMIISSIIEPNFILLAVLLCIFSWMGMSFYIRGEFLREKSKDYVSAAVALGARDRTIIARHILPNALTPIVSFAPFSIVSSIGALVSLDFLGFGLPAPTPSWGELMGQGLSNLHSWWLVTAPFGAMFFTLLLVSFIGEAVREAFDPREYSRLR